MRKLWQSRAGERKKVGVDVIQDVLMDMHKPIPNAKGDHEFLSFFFDFSTFPISSLFFFFFQSLLSFSFFFFKSYGTYYLSNLSK